MGPAKVPVWSKGMQLTPFLKSIEVWIENNKDLPEHSKYNEIIESLKLNKEIEGLSLYIGEHIVGKLDTVEKQTVKGLIELLKTKYGRTRQEELEELMMEWLKFDFNEYESEEDYLLAQEKLIARQEEKDISMKEWSTVWMMYGATQRQGTTDYHLQELRKVVKARGTNMQKEFITKYRELKVESHRGAQAACTWALYMGTRSKSRQRYEEQRIRRDSKGRDYYQDRKSRHDDRGRTFYRRYYRPQKDRRRSKDRKDSGDRSRSGCRACKCESCGKLVNLAKELKINWCQNITLNENIVENFTENRKHVMILDLGAPVSVAGTEWMHKYLKDHNLKLEKLEVHKCYQIFTFGPSKQYISKEMIKLPIILKTLDGREEVLQVFTYLIETDILFLCGASELKSRWKSKIDNENNVLEIKLEDGRTKCFKIIETSGNHVGIELEKGDVENKCRKGFNTKEELFEHCDIEHSYVCVNCDKEYNTESDLEDHIRKKHSQEKMRYRNKKEYQNIEEHRQKYICDLCNEEFKNESKLKKHGEINHKIHEEKKIGYLNG